QPSLSIAKTMSGEPPARASRWVRRAAAVEAAGRGGPVIIWLRHELRLADNPLLQQGLQLCAGGRALLLVFCRDPREFGPATRTQFGSQKVGDVRRRFVEESLKDLDNQLVDRGSRLCVFNSPPEEVFPALCAATGAQEVLAGAQFCPEERRAETVTAAALAATGASLRLSDPGGITTLLGAEDLRRAGLPATEAEFPEDFQAFYQPVRPLLHAICEQGLCEAPATLPGMPETLPADLQPCRLDVDQDTGGGTITGGEAAANRRLRTWMESGMCSYKYTFRKLLGDYSS
ncbi:CRYD, partial [Symbiodinium natans]